MQSIALNFVVGGTQPAPIETTVRGRPAASAGLLKPRDVGVRLALAGNGYECAVWGAVSSCARLPLQPAFLASAVEAMRQELMKVVMYQDAHGAYVFQTGIDIAAADRDAALKTMARAGALLFQKLFFGPAAGDDSKRIGTFLRQVASDPAKRLNLQIVAEAAPIPWGLLYVGDASVRRDARLGSLPRHAPRDRGDPAADDDGGARRRDRQRPAPVGQRQRQQRHRRPARRHATSPTPRPTGRRRRRRGSASA